MRKIGNITLKRIQLSLSLPQVSKTYLRDLKLLTLPLEYSKIVPTSETLQQFLVD